jgi:phosphatidylserine decarboxylase
MRKLRKIRLHQEGTHQLTVGFFVWILVNAAAYYLTYPEHRGLFILIAVFTTTLYLLLINFFRCPPRRFPGEDTEGIVVAPADGKIVVIEEVEEPDYFHDRRLMLSIFMSPLTVHANWYPVDGGVEKVAHENVKFHRAFLPKASTDNERSMLVMQTPEGKEVMVRQIAGAMARRIVTYAKAGEECFVDQHFGFIKLGSRVDVYLPVGSEVCVTMGQKTTGNQTILAKLK